MDFLEKMNKINALYKQSISNHDFERVSVLTLGAFEIAAKQFPIEFKSILTKYSIIQDISLFREKNQKLFNYIQTYYFDMPNFQIILKKNNKEVLIPFFNINQYLETKAISNEIEKFICLIFFADESNFQAFQLFNAIELLQSIKTK